MIERGLWNGSTLTYVPETFISDKFKSKNIVLHLSLIILGLLLAIVLLVLTLCLKLLFCKRSNMIVIYIFGT